VLFYVRRFLSFIPLELKLFHMYIVLMTIRIARYWCFDEAERFGSAAALLRSPFGYQ
jgi:hypothetical protein